MHRWDWQSWQGCPYLTCSVLKPWQHGFFTRRSQPPEALVQGLQPQAEVYRVKQVHGDVALNTAGLQPVAPSVNGGVADISEADGLFTTVANQAVWVCTADCTPVLIGDVATGRVAAIHAGWRGTAAAIVPKTIAQLQAQGSQIADLRIALGPAIAGEVYQVSTVVAAQVAATLLDIETRCSPETDSEEILRQIRQLPNSPISDDPEAGRARLDVRQVNLMQLERLGIEPDQVSVAPYCTYQNPELFFSYRRERQKQVQWSGIVSAEVKD